MVESYAMGCLEGALDHADGVVLAVLDWEGADDRVPRRAWFRHAEVQQCVGVHCWRPELGRLVRRHAVVVDVVDGLMDGRC